MRTCRHATHLQAGSAAKVVRDEHLLRFGQPELPGEARILDGRPLGRSGASVVARDEHVVSMALDHAASHHTDSVLTHQLDTHARVAV
jgi:hypothetical protein